LRKAAHELGISLRQCWMVGDTWMDAAAGRAAGCRTIMVGPDAATASELPREIRPDHAVRDLDAAARIVVGGASEGRAEGSLGGSARAPIGVG
jgi:D-glycero-D-manno-heptose 1,7-bisphosphate phosphatase